MQCKFGDLKNKDIKDIVDDIEDVVEDINVDNKNLDIYIATRGEHTEKSQNKEDKDIRWYKINEDYKDIKYKEKINVWDKENIVEELKKSIKADIFKNFPNYELLKEIANSSIKETNRPK